jgi:hypothetical protein
MKRGHHRQRKSEQVDAPIGARDIELALDLAARPPTAHRPERTRTCVAADRQPFIALPVTV